MADPPPPSQPSAAVRLGLRFEALSDALAATEDMARGDAWQGARVDARLRRAVARHVRRIDAEVDIGDPSGTVATHLLLIAIVLVTGVEFARHGLVPGIVELADSGGSGAAAVALGEWWKLLAANLLHAHPLHLGFNVLVIGLVGRWLEQLVGTLLVVAVIAWSSVAATIGALLVDAAIVGVGASGIAFGMLGCALAVDPRARTAVGQLARPLAIVNVAFTFLLPMISIGAHLGGLVVGLVLGWIAWRRRPSEQRPAGRLRRPLAVASAALAIPPVLLLAIGPSVLPDDGRALRGALVAPILARQVPDVFELRGGGDVSATCEPTADPRRYRCDFASAGADERDVPVSYAPGDPTPRLGSP